jgi:hypothetical protein
MIGTLYPPVSTDLQVKASSISESRPFFVKWAFGGSACCIGQHGDGSKHLGEQTPQMFPRLVLVVNVLVSTPCDQSP